MSCSGVHSAASACQSASDTWAVSWSSSTRRRSSRSRGENAPCRGLGARARDFRRRQMRALREEGHVHAPLVLGAAAGAGPVDHDLALAQRDRAAVEQAPRHDAQEHPLVHRERAEQGERRHARRHDALERGGHGRGIGWRERRDAGLGHGLPPSGSGAMFSVASYCYYFDSARGDRGAHDGGRRGRRRHRGNACGGRGRVVRSWPSSTCSDGAGRCA